MRAIHSNIPSYNDVVKWCLEDVLQLKEYEIDIIFCITKPECRGRFLQPNKIQVDQNLDENETLRVLFHELRHYYQSLTKMFDFDFEKYTKIKGNSEEDYFDYIKYRDEDIMKLISFELYECYLNYPWELDATKFATETFGKYLRRKYDNGS